MFEIPYESLQLLVFVLTAVVGIHSLVLYTITNHYDKKIYNLELSVNEIKGIVLRLCKSDTTKEKMLIRVSKIIHAELTQALERNNIEWHYDDSDIIVIDSAVPSHLALYLSKYDCMINTHDVVFKTKAKKLSQVRRLEYLRNSGDTLIIEGVGQTMEIDYDTDIFESYDWKFQDVKLTKDGKDFNYTKE
jgi:hypothetical protein